MPAQRIWTTFGGDPNLLFRKGSIIQSVVCRYNCVALADGVNSLTSSIAFWDITLTVASQFCRTCGVMSACLMTEFGIFFSIL